MVNVFRADGASLPLAALLGGMTSGGASVTMTRCDVSAAEEAAAATGAADAVLHAGGVLRVGCRMFYRIQRSLFVWI